MSTLRKPLYNIGKGVTLWGPEEFGVKEVSSIAPLSEGRERLWVDTPKYRVSFLFARDGIEIELHGSSTVDQDDPDGGIFNPYLSRKQFVFPKFSIPYNSLTDENYEIDMVTGSKNSFVVLSGWSSHNDHHQVIAVNLFGLMLFEGLSMISLEGSVYHLGNCIGCLVPDKGTILPIATKFEYESGSVDEESKYQVFLSASYDKAMDMLENLKEDRPRILPIDQLAENRQSKQVTDGSQRWAQMIFDKLSRL